MSTEQKLPEELKMFETLFNGENLNQSNLKSVFFVERENMTFNSPNIFDNKKNFPRDNEGDYFVAEFWFEYPSNNKHPSTYFVYSHVFYLDLEKLAEEIKEELDKKNIHSYSKISTPELFAKYVELNYDKVKKALLNISVNNDYKPLSIMICNDRGAYSGKGDFGL